MRIPLIDRSMLRSRMRLQANVSEISIYMPWRTRAGIWVGLLFIRLGAWIAGPRLTIVLPTEKKPCAGAC